MKPSKRVKLATNWEMLRILLPWVPYGEGGSTLLALLSAEFEGDYLEFHLSGDARRSWSGSETRLTLRGCTGKMVSEHSVGPSLEKLELIVGPRGCAFANSLRDLVAQRRPMRLETDSMQVVAAFVELRSLVFHLDFPQMEFQGVVVCAALRLVLKYEGVETVRSVLGSLRVTSALSLDLEMLTAGAEPTEQQVDALSSVALWMERGLGLQSVRLRSPREVPLVVLSAPLRLERLVLDGCVGLLGSVVARELHARRFDERSLASPPVGWALELSVLEVVSLNFVSGRCFARLSEWIERARVTKMVLGRFDREEHVFHILSAHRMVGLSDELYVVCAKKAFGNSCERLAKTMKSVHFVFI